MVASSAKFGHHFQSQPARTFASKKQSNPQSKVVSFSTVLVFLTHGPPRVILWTWLPSFGQLDPERDPFLFPHLESVGLACLILATVDGAAVSRAEIESRMPSSNPYGRAEDGVPGRFDALPPFLCRFIAHQSTFLLCQCSHRLLNGLLNLISQYGLRNLGLKGLARFSSVALPAPVLALRPIYAPHLAHFLGELWVSFSLGTHNWCHQMSSEACGKLFGFLSNGRHKGVR